jgi:hypothetical protein
LQFLNEREGDGHGAWKKDRREMTSELKFLNEDDSLGVSRLEPDQVVGVLAESKAQSAMQN